MELTPQQVAALQEIAATLNPDPLPPLQQTNKALQDLQNAMLAERVGAEKRLKDAVDAAAAQEHAAGEALLDAEQADRITTEAGLQAEIDALKAAYDQAKIDISEARSQREGVLEASIDTAKGKLLKQAKESTPGIDEAAVISEIDKLFVA